MTDTPPGAASSWIDLSNEISSGAYSLSNDSTTAGVFQAVSPFRNTPVPFLSDQDYMSMLKEAQKETSCRSSARVSPITSTLVSKQTSPCLSPKSPPNSPRTEIADFSSEFRDVFINKVKDTDPFTDFMWDWSSTPCPPKDMKCSSSSTSLSKQKEGGDCSSKVVAAKKPAPSTLSSLYTFLVTNLVSLILGVGLGAWIHRRSVTSPVKLL